MRLSQNLYSEGRVTRVPDFAPCFEGLGTRVTRPSDVMRQLRMRCPDNPFTEFLRRFDNSPEQHGECCSMKTFAEILIVFVGLLRVGAADLNFAPAPGSPL